jgi:metallophosphoesterase superfamily enzyme
LVKTTLEIPDSIFRRAKSVAARRGIALRAFVTEAVEEKLASTSQEEERAWVRLAGGVKHLHQETARINRIIRREFEKIEAEDWE